MFILVFQPDHMGTQAPLLLTWLVLDRFPRCRYTTVLVCVMLVWVDVADQLALLIGVAPLAVVSAIRAYQALVQRREGLRSAWFDLSLVLAAGASVVIASEVVKQIGAHGGYSVLPVTNSLAPVSEMSARSWLAVGSVFGLYGAEFLRHRLTRPRRGHRVPAPGPPGPGRHRALRRPAALLPLPGPRRLGAGRRDPRQRGRLPAQHGAHDILERP